MSRDKATKTISLTLNHESNYKARFSDHWINWIKPIHKRGEKNLVSNYQTNMAISLVMAKLYSPNMEQKISSWSLASSQKSTWSTETFHHQSFGCTWDNYERKLTSRVNTKFLCYEHQESLCLSAKEWHLGKNERDSSALRSMYNNCSMIVWCWLKTNNGFSKYLGNMGAKQAYPLYPTLFLLYIHTLEEILN